MKFIDLLRAFGFRGQEADIGFFIRGFDTIPPEFAAFKDQIRAAIGEDCFRVTPASTTRSPVFDDGTRSVQAVLTTEQPVKMIDWERYEYVDEVLQMSGFKGLRGGGSDVPFLNSHNRALADHVIGSTDSLKIEGDAILGRNIYSSREEDLYIKSKEGHITANSIGYRVLESTYIPAGETAIIGGKSYTASQARGMKIATAWEVHENSLTPIGADTRAGHRSKSPIVPLVPPPQTPSQKDAATMKYLERAKALNAPESALVSEETARAWLDEYDATSLRARNALLGDEIRSVFSSSLDIVGIPEVLQKQLDLAKDGKTNVGSARQALTDALIVHSRSFSGVFKPGQSGGNDGTANFKRDMVAALLVRNHGTSLLDANTQKAAKAFAGISSEHFARTLAQRHNISLDGMDRGTALKAVLFSPYESEAQRAAASDFKDITNAVARQTITLGFESEAETWSRYCDTENLPDFEPHTMRNFSALRGEIPVVKELGEYTNRNDYFAKEDSAVRLTKFGETFYLSWEAMLADQLGAFAKIGFIQAQNWRRTLNRMPLRLLQSNPVMGDGHALFSTEHKNLIAGVGNNPKTSRATAMAAVRAHYLALRKQTLAGAKDDDLDIIDANLAYVIGGIDSQENLYNALFTKGADDDSSAFIQSLKAGLMTDPMFDQLFSPTAVIGLGSVGPASPLVMSFLSGLGAAPRLNTLMDDKKDALEFRLTGAAVCGARTWRGVTQSTGLA